MPDWTQSMQQSYEYYTVEPTTLADIKRLDNVKSATFNRDSDSETLGSASIDVTPSVGETYIRGYLKTIQNGVTEKFSLGMVLSQTPSSSFNGKILDVSMDCYTPLIELKEKKPPLGYTVRKGTRIMDAAYRIVRENARVPVNKVEPIIKKGKNLFDEKQITTCQNIRGASEAYGVVTDEYLQAKIGAYGTTTFWTGFKVYLKSGVIYTISADMYYATSTNGSYSIDMGVIQVDDYTYGVHKYVRVSDYDTWERKSIFFKVTKDAYYYIRLQPGGNKTQYRNLDCRFKNIQIEKGSTATSYESYFGMVDLSPTLQNDFVANTDDTWLSFIIDLIANAKYELGLGERGDILFLPKQDMASLQPVWTYTDDNSSILYPELTMNHDLYGIPNVVEVLYSYGSDYKQAVAKNEDPNSPISTINRGREIVHRVTDPSLAGYVTQEQIQNYAEQLLKELSTIEYTVSYTHAYCPVRVGDCVLLNYTRAGIKNVKAKVISRSIKCEPGCPVSEKAVFTSKLWG